MIAPPRSFILLALFCREAAGIKLAQTQGTQPNAQGTNFRLTFGFDNKAKTCVAPHEAFDEQQSRTCASVPGLLTTAKNDEGKRNILLAYGGIQHLAASTRVNAMANNQAQANKPPKCWVHFSTSNANPPVVTLTTKKAANNQNPWPAGVIPAGANGLNSVRAICLVPTNANGLHTGTGGASVFGDPFVTNLKGDKFEISRPGIYNMVEIPKRPESNILESKQTLNMLEPGAAEPKLHISAAIRRANTLCKAVFIKQVNISGTWAPKGGLIIDVNDDHTKPALLMHNEHTLQAVKKSRSFIIPVGPVHVMVEVGNPRHREDPYINLDVKHLAETPLEVGGILGTNTIANIDTLKPKHCLSRLQSTEEEVLGLGSRIEVSL